MSVDTATASALIVSGLGVSGGLLAWVNRIAENRGKKFAEQQSKAAEGRVDRNEIIAYQEREIARKDAEVTRLTNECVSLRGERDAMDVARRAARDKLRTTDDLNDDLMRYAHRADVYMRQAKSLLDRDDDPYPNPPAMPDPPPPVKEPVS